MEKYTLITGGASGLGLDLSKLFAKDGNNLFLVSSNIKNLESAKELLEKEYGVKVHVLATDLSIPANFLQVKDYSDKNDMFINNLVNCAGFGDCTDFKDMDIDRQIRMIELNCNAPLYFMRVYLDNMLKNNEGHILNIASIASFYPGPYMCTYHASKAFLLNISEAIERELKGTNVKLSVVCPGPFESSFVDKAHNTYTFNKMKPLSSQKVADISYKTFKKNKSLKIIGFGNKLSLFASRFFPRKFITNVSAGQIKGK
jgi:hypothetical protein